MSDSFSTNAIPVAERLDAWLSYAKPICGDCRFHFPKRRHFNGSIVRRSIAGAAFTRFSSTAVSFAKFPVIAANSEGPDCIIITQLAGIRQYCQGGAMAILSPGDTTLVDAARPWTSDCTGDCDRLYLRVPLWVVQERLKRAPLPVLPRIIGKRGLGASLYHLAVSLYSEADDMPAEEGAIALGAYFDILAGCFAGPETFSTSLGQCAQLRPRIEHYIEKHLPESDLSPTMIATANGISVRHLHRVFAAKGCTVAEWIRERRLERCRTDLADPLLVDGSITDIAFSWGFSDSAHFSHCFRNEFGVSPRQFRSNVRAKMSKLVEN